jgi:hypothetical protein
MEVVAADGTVTEVPATDGTVTEVPATSASAVLRWSSDGAVALAWPVTGASSGRAGELAVGPGRLYLDLVVRGGDTLGGTTVEAQGKDSAVAAIDVDTT